MMRVSSAYFSQQLSLEIVVMPIDLIDNLGPILLDHCFVIYENFVGFVLFFLGLIDIYKWLQFMGESVADSLELFLNGGHGFIERDYFVSRGGLRQMNVYAFGAERKRATRIYAKI